MRSVTNSWRARVILAGTVIACVGVLAVVWPRPGPDLTDDGSPRALDSRGQEETPALRPPASLHTSQSPSLESEAGEQGPATRPPVQPSERPESVPEGATEQELMGFAYRASKKGDWQRAIRLIQAAVELATPTGNLDELQGRLAVVLLLRGDGDEAYRNLSSFVARCAENAVQRAEADDEVRARSLCTCRTTVGGEGAVPGYQFDTLIEAGLTTARAPNVPSVESMRWFAERFRERLLPADRPSTLSPQGVRDATCLHEFLVLNADIADVLNPPSLADAREAAGQFISKHADCKSDVCQSAVAFFRRVFPEL